MAQKKVATLTGLYIQGKLGEFYEKGIEQIFAVENKYICLSDVGVVAGRVLCDVVGALLLSYKRLGTGKNHSIDCKGF